MNLLLKNIYYGDELPKLEIGSKALRHFFATVWQRLECGGDANIPWENVYSNIRRFFKAPRPGLFDGPITAGDALAISAFMSAIRPRMMIEIGAASGFSAAFIIQTARGLDLTQGSDTFLHSLDIVTERDDGAKTGQLLLNAYPDLQDLWHLHSPATSLDLLTGALMLPDAAPILAFVDGGHSHPWPLADIAAMYKLLPRGSWILMQDTQIMERWISDCVRYGAPSKAPVRGVQLAVSHWPGAKWIGQGLSYNMAALKLDVTDDEFLSYLEAMLDYPDEEPFEGRGLLMRATQS